MASIRKIWIISIQKLNVIYSKTFNVIEKRAQKMNLTTIKDVNDKALTFGVLKSLGLDSLCDIMLYRGDVQVDVQYDNIDVSLDMNQMPILSVDVSKDQKLFPILVVENMGLLFCVLPLIDDPINSGDAAPCGSETLIIDMIDVSLSYSLINEVIDIINCEEDLKLLESFFINKCPLGLYLGIHQDANNIGAKAKSDKREVESKDKEASILIKVDEKLFPLPGTRTPASDIAHGTLTVNNQSISSPNAELIIKKKDISANFDVILSPGCDIIDGDTIKIKLSNQVPKYFHYIVKTPAVAHESGISTPVNIPSLFSYQYKLSKQSSTSIKFELIISLDKGARNTKFNFFSVNFRDGFIDNSCKLSASDLNHGTIGMEANKGLVWNFGRSFPSSGRAIFTGEFLVMNNLVDPTPAMVNFKIDNHFRNFLSVSKSNIFTGNIDRDAKLLIVNSMVGNDIKLYPSKE